MINYNNVVAAFDGQLVSLTPKRAKKGGEPSEGMVLRVRLANDKVVTVEDETSAVIDDLYTQLNEGD